MTDAPVQGHPHPHAGILQKKKNEVEKRAVDIFVYGLLENLLKLKILKENPANLKVAISTAASEQNLRRRFSLQTRHHGIPDEEHIEVDHFRPAPRDLKFHRVGGERPVSML